MQFMRANRLDFMFIRLEQVHANAGAIGDLWNVV